jgi:hypothetical protein
LAAAEPADGDEQKLKRMKKLEELAKAVCSMRSGLPNDPVICPEWLAYKKELKTFQKELEKQKQKKKGEKGEASSAAAAKTGTKKANAGGYLGLSGPGGHKDFYPDPFPNYPPAPCTLRLKPQSNFCPALPYQYQPPTGPCTLPNFFPSLPPGPG